MSSTVGIKKNQSKLNKLKKELEKAIKNEAMTRAKWNEEFNKYNDAVEIAMSCWKPRNKKERRIKEKALGFRPKSHASTKERDQFRNERENIKANISAIENEIKGIVEKMEYERKNTDSIVDHVFSLNNSVVAALLNRNAFLNTNLFHRLRVVNQKGKPLSQATIINSESTRKAVALVNTITKLDPELANKAQTLIQQFFDRITGKAEMDRDMLAIYELTKGLFVENTTFKPGELLYKFLIQEFNQSILPELVEAQKLLKQSLRSERTNTYIRLYERKSRGEKWVEVKQS
ncbi:MAG: hypothetical protein V1928_04300 [Parcubacteria group bacterium]